MPNPDSILYTQLHPLHAGASMQGKRVLCGRQAGQQVICQRSGQPRSLPLLLVELAQLLDGACCKACITTSLHCNCFCEPMLGWMHIRAIT